MLKYVRLALLAALGAALLAPTASAAFRHPLRHPSRTDLRSRQVCTTARRGYAHCNSTVVVRQSGFTLAASSPTGYGPAQFQTAYGLPSTSAGAGQTIAIVDAYNDPTAEQDLATYSNTYGLPACTTANGCFKKVNQNGVQGSYPANNQG